MKKCVYLILVVFSIFTQIVNATNFYVEAPTNGGDDANDGSVSAPFATIRKAAETAVNPGDVIQIGPGVFSEPDGQITIHDGVNMFGAGIDVTFIESTYSPGADYIKNVLFKAFDGVDAWHINSHGTNGNEFAHFTLNGHESLGIGIDIRERDNVHIHDVKFMNTVYAAFVIAQDEQEWGDGTTTVPTKWNENILVHDIQVFDGGGIVYYSGTGYGTEAIKIGRIDGGEFYNMYVEEEEGGVMICSWNEGWNKNLSIHDNEFIINVGYGYPGHPEWGNYMNIEFKNPVGLHEVYNNKCTNMWWSFVSGLDYWGDAIYNPETDANNPKGLVLDMHDNDVRLADDANYILALELGWGYSEVYDNFFYAPPENPNKGTLYGLSVTIRDIGKTLVHHNIIDGFTSGVLVSNDNQEGKSRMDTYITQNTVVHSASYGVRINAVEPLENVYVKNNIFYSMDGPWGPHAMVYIKGNSTNTFTNVQITNNVQYLGNGDVIKYENSTAESRMVNSVIENNSEANPRLNLSGDMPFPYYELSSQSSAAIDFGTDLGYAYLGAAPDAGVAEYGMGDAGVAVSSVNIDQSGVAVYEGFTAQLTATVLPLNAENRMVSWSSDNTSVATVDATTGLVTGLAAGTANITATTIDGGLTDISTVTVSQYVGCTAQGYIERERWDLITGTSISNLTSSADYPDNPSNIATLNSLEYVDGSTDNYGIRIRGYICAPTSGDYTFWIAGDDNVEFWISSDFQPENRARVAFHSDWTSMGEWNKYTSQKSAPISLIAERSYYIEVFLKEGTGGDFVQVGWLKPGETGTEPSEIVPGSVLSPFETVGVTSVSINEGNQSIYVGEAASLTATVLPTDATNPAVNWSSSNTNVATVSENGLVSALSAGTATITVTTADGGYADNVTITVSEVPTVNVTSVSIDQSNQSIDDGTTTQLTTTVMPSNATNKTVIWSSGNSAVAAVNPNGLVSGVSAGTTTITATTDDGGYTDNVTITVNEVAVTSVTINEIEPGVLEGETTQLNAIISPDNASNQNVSWSSSNTSIATVDDNGLVTGVAVGTATITVTSVDGSYIATCNVTVTESVFGTGTHYYVETPANGGNDINNGSASAPFATIRKACETAVNVGDVIHIGAGTFSEPDGEITVHDGVSMFGAGIDATIIESDYSPSGNYMANVLFKVFDGADAWNINSHGTNGNEFAYFTINGFEQLGVAIDARNRDNIHFHDFKIINCYYSALHVCTDEDNWGAGSQNYYPSVWNKNIKLHDLQIINGGGRVEFDKIYGSEAIKVGNIDGGELYNLYVEEDQGGTLICSWNEGWNKNFSVHDNEFILSQPYGYPGHPEWGNYMNIEFKNPIGLHEVYNNKNTNVWWSFVSGLDYWGDAIYDPDTEYGLVLDMHDNEVVLETDANYILALELGWGYSEVYNNVFLAEAGNPNQNHLYGVSVAIRDINRFLVHHNIIDGFSSGVLISNDNVQNKPRKNVYITNNVIANSVTYGLRLNALKPLEDIFIKNNIFYRMDGVYGPFAATYVKGDPSPSFTNVQITNNMYYLGDGEIIHYENNNAIGRMVNPVIQDNLEADPQFVLTGDYPYPHYELSSLNSPAVDFGVDVSCGAFELGDFLGAAPDAGAKEMGASNPAEPVTSLTIDQGDSMDISFGSTASLSATVTPADASYPDVYWNSSNDAVVAIDRFTGVINAISEGQAIILAKTLEDTYKDSIIVNVTYNHVTNVTINEGNQIIDENTYKQLTLSILPTDADNTNVTWSSSDETVAVVDANGEVYGMGPGTATITVTTEDGGLTDAVNFTVNDVYVPVSGVTISAPATDVYITRTLQLTELIEPITADNKTVTWISSNTALATVDANGLVTGVAEGTVTITVTADDGGYTASKTLSVLPVPPNDLPWIENFSGLADGTEEDTGETAWSITGNASTHLMVVNERLEGLRTYNTGVMLVTEPINIDFSATSFSVDISEKGSMEYQDYVKVYYQIDGGAQILAGEVSDDQVGGEDDANESEVVTISVDNLTGASLEISIEVYCSGGDEYWFIDNLHVYESGTTANNVTGVAINESDQSLVTGNTVQLTATVSPTDADNTLVTWSSDNTAVATVDANGMVTAIDAGSAIVTVTTDDGGFTDNVMVSVTTEDVAVTGVSIDQSSPSVNYGGTILLTATVAPTDATDKSVSWISDNTSVATVDASGLVTAVDEGTANITVTTTDGGYTDTETVTVNPAPINDLPWEEDFTGLADGTMVDDGATAWSIQGNPSNYLEVRSEKLEGNKVYSAGIMLVTEDINISGSTVSISVEVQKMGYMEYQDYVRLYYVIDGGTPVLADEVLGDELPEGDVITDAVTLSAVDISGTTLQVQIEVLNNWTNETWYVDNLSVISSGGSTSVAVTSVSINEGNQTIDEGATVQLSKTVSPTDATNKSVAWSSSNTAIATVDANGLVSGVAAGIATVTVTTDDGGYTDNVTVTVNESSVAVTSVSINEGNQTIDEGATVQLSKTVSPTDATNQSVAWSSSNTTIATVDANGLVTGVAAGTATITVTTADGGYTDIVTVMVNAVTVPVTSVAINEGNQTIDEGSTVQLTATVSPTDATNQSVTWSSANTAVATVDANGLVSGIAAGTTTITVTTDDGGYTDNVTVAVNESTIAVTGVAINEGNQTIDEGATVQLTATVSPTDATNQSVSWSSSGTEVATVDANGLVSGIAAGTTTITVTTDDGSYTDNVTVTVNESTVAVTGVAINEGDQTIDEGATVQLTATVSPTDATNQSVSWSSSGTAVATVDANGLVSGIAAGTTTITVTTDDGSYTDNITITVNEVVTSNDLPWTEDFSGLADGTMIDDGETAWSIVGTPSNYLEVRSEKLEGNKVYQSGVKLVSEDIDITGVSDVGVSVDVQKWGWMEYQDYVKLYYVVDGGTPVFADEVLGDYAPDGDYISDVVSLSASGISGNTLQIQIEIRNDWTNETWYVDNIEVFNSSLKSSSGMTGISLFQNYEWNIYPNPVNSDFINITTSANIAYDIAIFNLQGKAIMVKSNCNSDVKLNAQNLKPGVYIVSLKPKKGTVQRKKLVVN